MKIPLCLFLLAFGCQAAVQTQTVDYATGEIAMQGYLAYDDANPGPRPAVLIVHDWMGLGDFARTKAKALAEMGYVAFAADIYGTGIRPANQQEAAQLAGKYKKDREQLRARITAALDLLRKHDRVDRTRIAAIGYCFGGTTVLELARSGAELAGVVSFHGSLETSLPAKPGQVKAKVLVLHGADDPYVPDAEVAAFEAEMRKAGVDWQLVKYSGAVHSFTEPRAGNDPTKGAAYNATADRRSWEAMKTFFAEIFR